MVGYVWDAQTLCFFAAGAYLLFLPAFVKYANGASPDDSLAVLALAAC
ncbi:hypothetical protein Q31b_30570 [Novipirellula aureliae]|uniref:Uncharacterized protein n=1 Tax=Novipirellula aureliae TaxID=2527966 RepID=A0A5C6E2K5_9BACT|nr:hypothetical protein Q31b_30570 [Novipirellula aureliae]